MHGPATLAELSAKPGFDASKPALETGAVRREITERATGMDKRQWQAAYGPYLERTFATGRFPALATLVRDGADQTFRTGLDFLLDGIEARISR